MLDPVVLVIMDPRKFDPEWLNSQDDRSSFLCLQSVNFVTGNVEFVVYFFHGLAPQMQRGSRQNLQV